MYPRGIISQSRHPNVLNIPQASDLAVNENEVAPLSSSPAPAFRRRTAFTARRVVMSPDPEMDEHVPSPSSERDRAISPDPDPEAQTQEVSYCSV